MKKLDYTAVLSEAQAGAAPKDLARKYKTKIQNIYNAISREKRKEKLQQRALRKTLRRPRFPRPSKALTSLVADEITSLERKQDQIASAIQVLRKIGSD